MLTESPCEADALPHVPVGRAKAATALEIWKAVNCWSDLGIRHALTNLSDRRVINRDREPIPGGFRWVYWRSRQQ